MYIYNQLKNGDTTLQKDLKKKLNEISSGNPKHKSSNQPYVIENVKNFYN